MVKRFGSRSAFTCFQVSGIDTGAPGRARGDSGATAVAILLGQQPDLIQVKLAHLSNSSRKIICLIGQNSHYRSEIGGSLNNDDPEFAKMSTQRIDELGTMAHEALVRSKRHRSGLMFSP